MLTRVTGTTKLGKCDAEAKKSNTKGHILIPFIWSGENRPIHRDRKQLSGPRAGGQEGTGGEGRTATGYGVLFWGDENALGSVCWSHDFVTILKTT